MIDRFLGILDLDDDFVNDTVSVDPKLIDGTKFWLIRNQLILDMFLKLVEPRRIDACTSMVDLPQTHHSGRSRQSTPTWSMLFHKSGCPRDPIDWMVEDKFPQTMPTDEGGFLINIRLVDLMVG